MQVVETIAQLRVQVHQWRAKGLKVGFVPTMGNLHAGHLSLVELAQQQADRVVVSVFVNPLQFGPNEDFERYPRTFEADRDQLQAQQADVLFVPSVAEIYPFGQQQTQVCVPEALTGLLEGAERPGHFDGVTTVVLKLFNMVQPDYAVFGQKDFQQLRVLQRMVAELALPIELVAAPIARDEDGLALSSRNQYLTPAQRDIAPQLARVLQTVAADLQLGRRDFVTLEQSACCQLNQLGFDQVDYVSIRDAQTLTLPSETASGLVILAVARLGSTRLLDNILLESLSA